MYDRYKNLNLNTVKETIINFGFVHSTCPILLLMHYDN